VDITGITTIYDSASQINLAGGTLKSGALNTTASGASRFNWTGGTLQLAGGTSNVSSLSVPSTGTLKGTGTIIWSTSAHSSNRMSSFPPRIRIDSGCDCGESAIAMPQAIANCSS
jgi:hypothetical protein